MAKQSASYHLLFGVLAFQNGCIDENQFLGAVRNWLKNKNVPLEKLLVESKALSPADRDMLIPMVQRHVEDHGGDASISIAATAGFEAFRQQLENLEDEEIDDALERVAESIAAQEYDPLITVPTPELGSALVGSQSDVASRFRVIRPHRGGGMGLVLVAADTEIADREVAFKQIREEYADQPLSRQQFRVEAEITGGLEHPNIVPVYGLGADSTGRPFYAMRFIRGESLREAIRDYYRDADSVAWAREKEGEQSTPSQRKRYRFRRLLEKFIDVCEAIHYAHSRGVLHRDLKPGNVMLGRYNEVLVVDWGLAISTPRDEESKVETDEATLVVPSADDKTGPKKGLPEGTPAYMAPEQAIGRVDLFGKHTDVYALGATFYCILTGQPPFATDSEWKTTLSRVETGDFARPTAVGKDVPRPLEAICLKAMSTRIKERYASADELAKDVQRWLDDEPVSAWKEPLTVTVARWMRHHQTIVAGIAAAIIVGLVAAIFLWRAEIEARKRETALYTIAKQAVDQFYTEVSEEGLLSQPGMEEKRNQLLNQAKTAYAGFQANYEQYGSEAEEELARTLFRLGVITHGLGEDQEALDFHKRALAKQILLVTEKQQPENKEHENERLDELIARAMTNINQPNFGSTSPAKRFDLANTLNAIGVVLNDNNDRTTARDAFDAALLVRRGLAKEEGDPRNKRKLANTLMNLSVIERKDGELESALNRIQESNAIRNDPSLTDYNDYEWNRDVALGLVNEGVLIDAATAIVKYKEAIGVIDGLLEAPKNIELEKRKSDLTLYLIKRMGPTEEQKRLINELIARDRALCVASPDVPDYKVSLSGALVFQGDSYYVAGDWAAARQQYEEVVDLLNSSDLKRRNWAYAQKVLAKIDEREDKLDAARERIEQSIAEFSKLVNEDGANQGYKRELEDAVTFRHKIRARQFLRDDKPEDAVGALDTAIKEYERMLKQRESRLKRQQLEDCQQLRERALSGDKP